MAPFLFKHYKSKSRDTRRVPHHRTTKRVPSMPKFWCEYPTCDCTLEKSKQYRCPKGLTRREEKEDD